jgi:Zn-dependent peptidase ImmA (M78 family)
MGIQILPFDIKKYLINSGVEIIYEEMDNMSGYLKKKEESFLIGINKYQNEARQRFTMAHELAHIVLHSKGDGKKEFRDIILFRDSEKFDKKEIEANNFAGELLMPKDYFNDAIMNNINTCEKLAEHFNVSPAAARYRAYKLGYIGSY